MPREEVSISAWWAFYGMLFSTQLCTGNRGYDANFGAPDGSFLLFLGASGGHRDEETGPISRAIDTDDF